MILIAFLIFFALYLLVSLLIVIAIWRWAGHKWRHGWLMGVLATVAIYQITYVYVLGSPREVYQMHEHYCQTEAGFWVYKTPEQWIKENPDTVGEPWGSFHRQENISPTIDRLWLSSRVYWDVINAQPFYAIDRKEQKLVDARTGEVLAREIEFYRGSTGLALGGGGLVSYQFWLAEGKRVCGPGRQNGYDKPFHEYLDRLYEMGKGRK
ncbi:hypothetical protein [Pseudogulbenkiania subflava]|uniref:Uncharacterized protein n=1 Tax=Pseudogulbenkiania subflava DSM 22618 TaxID=1123014 RepID=A0A1Y6BAJ8_9NEIS|nr:hypothetical protein [Pseudogulbenkiania subflava]SMF01495.1 hypothetical protein SAMN02745746_00727 [Pseudogulbenkiania subflava DSM 22618]